MTLVYHPKARWFSMLRVLLPSGVVNETPHEACDLCWPCGTSLEVWPLEVKEELIQKIETKAAFRREFMAVRAGAEKAEYRLFKLQEVRNDRGCGMRVCVKAALVEEGVFKTHFGVPADALWVQSDLLAVWARK